MNSKNKTVKVVLIIVIIALLALIAGCVIKGGQTEDSEPVTSEESLMYGDEYLGIDAQVDEDLQGFENILIMALDTESIKDSEGEIKKDGVVTDSNVIFSINKETHDGHMFSILRTTELMINEGYGVDKMMNAYYYDGADLAMYTVNTNLDLNVREYIVLTWATVRDIVNHLGGIELDIPAGDLPYINKLLSADNQITKAGMQVFNGEQAVQYCRYIIDGDDETRHERFKKVLEEAFVKADALEAEEKVEATEEFFDLIYTNIPNQHLSEMLAELEKHEIITTDVWPFTENAGEDFASNVAAMHSFMFGQEEYEPTETVKSISERLNW